MDNISPFYDAVNIVETSLTPSHTPTPTHNKPVVLPNTIQCLVINLKRHGHIAHCRTKLSFPALVTTLKDYIKSRDYGTDYVENQEQG